MTHIRVLGVPMDMGTSRRGVDMGPFAVRYADVRSQLAAMGHTVEDAGNVAVPFREDLEPGPAGGPYFLGAISGVCRSVATEVRRALSDGCVPLVLGGDHSLAAGSVAGAAAHLAARGERLGVVWVDAHADVNTPASSPSGNIHGMPLAHLLGRGDAALTGIAGTTAALRPEDCAVVGVRDLDAPEQRHLKEWGVKTFTMRDIDERGTHAVMDEALETASKHTSGTWLSFDLDVVDPSLAPGVGTPVPGGMTYREAHHVMELVADSHRLVGMDMVEVNPVLDVRNQTADLAAQLILSAFGKRIL